MRIHCPQCKSQYNVDENRIPPQGVQIKCPKCLNAFVVQAPGADGGAVALPGGGGAVPLPGGGGAVPLPGGGGAVPLPGGGGAVPLPGMGGGGAVPLPGMGGGGAVPLPGMGGGGAVPLPGMGGGGAVPLPGMGGGGAVPLPGMGGGGAVPLPGMGGGGAPMPRAANLSDPEMVRAGGPAVSDSVVMPFHGQTASGPAPSRAPAAPAPTVALGGGVLDFIDRAAEGTPQKAAVQYRIRKRSGKVVGPVDEQGVLRMLRGHELLGSEEASEDGVSWKPLSQVPSFAAEIQSLMASALGSLADLPAPAQSDLPAPAAPRAADGLGDPFADLALDAPARPAGGADAGGAAAQGLALLGADPAAPAVAKQATKRVIKTVEEEKAKFPIGLALGSITFLVLVAVGAVTEFAMPGVGAFGRKKFFAPPEVVAPPPKLLVAKAAVVVPTWEGTSIESLLSEDNSGSYQEARKKLQAELSGGNEGAALALLQTFALPAFLDGSKELVPQANEALEKGKGVDPRSADAFRVFLLLAEGNVDEAQKLSQSLVAAPVELKDASLAVRQRESWVMTGAGFVALAKNAAITDAYKAFDQALTAWSSNVVATVAQAQALDRGGDKATALEYAERAVELEPDNLRARLLAGTIHAASGKSRQAMAHLQHAAGAVGAKGTPGQRAAAHLAVSNLAFQDRDFKLALDEMKNALAEVPDDIDMMTRFGELALRMRDWTLARTIFDDLLQRRPGNVPGIIGAARAKIGATNALEGYRQLEEALKERPNNAQLAYWFGFANEALGKVPEAVGYYKKAESLDPKRAAPVVAQARILIAARKYGDATKLLEPARGRVDPAEEHLLRASMAEVFLRQRNLPLALKSFAEVLEAAPDDTEARALYARTLRESGKSEEAEKQLKRALEDDPKNALILAEAGTYWESRGQYERAVDLFQQAVAVSPKDPDYHIRLGAATLKKGDAATAQDHFKNSQQLAPTNPDFFYWMALAVRKTDPDKAKGLLKQGMEISPEDGRFDHELARTVGGEGAILEAVDYLRQAVRKDPKNGEAYFEMGKFLSEQTRYREAREQLERASELLPNSGPIHLAIADTYERTGEYDQARKQYTLAIKKDSNLSEAHCKMGDVWRLDQKLKQAINSYETCLQLNPKHKTAWRWLGFAYAGMGGKANKQKAISAFQKHLNIAPDDPQNADVEDAMSELKGH